MPCKGKHVLVWSIIGIPWILWIVFLALYLDIKYSDPAVQLETCRSELKNRTSVVNDTIVSLKQRVEALVKAEKAATAVAEGLRVQLETAEQGFVQTEKYWESCRNQLKTLAQNFTAEMGDAMQREVKKCQAETDKLQNQLSNQMEKLKEAQQKNQQQREDCEAKIQHLKAEQSQRVTPSGAAGPVTPVATFLAVAFLFLP